MTTVQQREFECPARRGPCCGMIDMMIGWRQPVDMPVCDQCLAVGGHEGCASADVRSKYVQLCLTNLKAKGLHNYPPEMGSVVLHRHASIAEYGTLSAQVREAERRAKEGPTFRRWGLTWKGIAPWYRWPDLAGRQGLRVFWMEIKRLYAGGCGCKRSKA